MLIETLVRDGASYQVCVDCDASILVNLVEAGAVLQHKDSCRDWSSMQRALFAEVASGKQNIIVDAVPGSGKTTSIVQAMRYVPRGRSILAVAFNKSIATEMQARVPPGVTVSTLHSHGFRAVNHAFKNPRPLVDADKGRNISREVAQNAMRGWSKARLLTLVKEFATKHGYEPGTPERRDLSSQVQTEVRVWADNVAKCVSLSKGYLAFTPVQIEAVIDEHQICPPSPEDEAERPMFVAQVQAALKACKEDTSKVDFDDMVWFSHVHRLDVQQFDEVFVDERQDLTKAQLALVMKTVRKIARGGGGPGRITAVGDPRQQIYQFAGAGGDTLQHVEKSLNAKVLPLSISYRCSKAVVQAARGISPLIEAAPTAEEGSVTTCLRERMIVEAEEGDFILSRATAPLMDICLELLRAGKRAAVQGKDIGTKLIGTMQRAKTENVDKMLAHVDAYTAMECKRLAAQEKDATAIVDTQACIHALAEGEKTVKAIIAKIERLFADGDSMGRITLSTTHKAKGLERDRVWMLRDTYMKTRPGETEPDLSEANLFYVAITRAKRDLFLVVPPPKTGGQQMAG